MLYTVPMAVAAVAPWAMGLTGAIYGIGASLLSGMFLLLALRVGFSRETEQAKMKPERHLFAFSILYLFMTFGLIVADKVLA